MLIDTIKRTNTYLPSLYPATENSFVWNRPHKTGASFTTTATKNKIHSTLSKKDTSWTGPDYSS